MEKIIMYELCQFLIGKVQRCYLNGEKCNRDNRIVKCQFLIGKVQQKKNGGIYHDEHKQCQFLIGKVQRTSKKLVQK